MVRGRPRGPAVNALFLMLGTLTVLPVPRADRGRPAYVGAGDAAGPASAGWCSPYPWCCWRSSTRPRDCSPTLLVALLAVLTRGLHLDGLADTADGLGSGRRGEAALAVMRQSDIGPFGVVTLVLALLVQVAALAVCLAAGAGPAVCWSRWSRAAACSPLLCTPAFPAARRDGLGRAVRRHRDGGAGGAVAAGRPGRGGRRWRCCSAPARCPDADDVGPVAVLLPALAPLAGLGLRLARRARRFGGVTGDVLRRRGRGDLHPRPGPRRPGPLTPPRRTVRRGGPSRALWRAEPCVVVQDSLTLGVDERRPDDREDLAAAADVDADLGPVARPSSAPAPGRCPSAGSARTCRR